MGSCCTRSVFWVNWVILTALYRLWNWRNRSAFTRGKPQEVLHFSIENLWRFGWQYIAQVSFARWRSSDKQLGPRTVNLVLIAARRCYTRIPVHASHSWLISMDFITGAARRMKAILVSKHRRGSTYTQMARAQSVGTARIQDLSMPELSLNNRNTLILLNLNVTVHGHNMETSRTFLLLLQVCLG